LKLLNFMYCDVIDKCPELLNYNKPQVLDANLGCSRLLRNATDMNSVHNGASVNKTCKAEHRTDLRLSCANVNFV